MRVKDVEQTLRDLGEFIVDFQMNARGEKGKPLEQPLDMRIVTSVHIQLQTRGNLRVLFGELLPHLSKEGEFVFIIVEKIVTHSMCS
jgi:hypothetical protein